MAPAVAAMIIAGCGSNAPSETGTAGTATATSTANKLSAHDQAVKFAECIRDARRQRLPGPERQERLRRTESA